MRVTLRPYANVKLHLGTELHHVAFYRFSFGLGKAVNADVSRVTYNFRVACHLTTAVKPALS